MEAKSLESPSLECARHPLAIVDLHPSRLFRISKYNTGEPHFGVTGKNRFDDPEKQYGTCYFGTTLMVAISETLLHDEVAKLGQFEIESTALQNYHVIRLQGAPLKLANLTGAPLKRLNGHGDLSATFRYDITQRWSSFVFAHPDNVDGFKYMSRHMNSNKAVVVFDRAKSKINFLGSTSLVQCKGFASAGRALGIRAM